MRLLYLLVLLFSPLPEHPPTPLFMVDPLFSIKFDPARVHFDPIPSLVGDRCSQMRDYYVRGWVYGHLKANDKEYFIVDGLVKVESEKQPGTFYTLPDEGSGIFVELGREGCVVDALPYIFFPNLNKQHSARIHVSDATLISISDELLRRYARAFGSRRQFLQRIHKSQREKLPSFLRSELDKYEKGTVL